MSPEGQRDDTIITTDTANEILECLDRFHYASLDHVLFALLRETGVRIGAARGVDVPDVETREERVVLRHRPGAATAWASTYSYSHWNCRERSCSSTPIGDLKKEARWGWRPPSPCSSA